MGFWSTLGKGLLGAIPVVGGAVSGLLGGDSNPAGDVGTVMGKDAAAAAQGRVEQAKAQQAQDRNAMDLYAMNLKAPSTATSQAVRGSLIQNMQDAHITPTSSRVQVPQMSGGLRPSALGDGGRAAGAGLFSTAMGNLNNMKPVTPPTLTPLPEPSTWDNINKVGGRTGSILGALSPVMKNLFGGDGGGGGDFGGFVGPTDLSQAEGDGASNWWDFLPGAGN